MVYSKRFDKRTNCVIHAPDGTPQEEIDAAVEIGRRIFLKMKKREKFKITLFLIFGICAAAVSAVFVIRRKMKNGKE